MSARFYSTTVFLTPYRRTAKSIKIRYYGTLSRGPKPRTSLDMGSRHFVPGYVFFLFPFFFSLLGPREHKQLFFTHTHRLQQHAMSPYQHIPGYTPSSQPYQYQLVSNLNRGNGAPHHKMPAAHGSSAMSSLLFASNQKMKLEASQQQQSNQTSSKPVELGSSDEDPGIDSEEEEKVSSTGSTSSSGVGL